MTFPHLIFDVTVTIRRVSHPYDQITLLAAHGSLERVAVGGCEAGDSDGVFGDCDHLEINPINLGICLMLTNKVNAPNIFTKNLKRPNEIIGKFKMILEELPP